MGARVSSDGWGILPSDTEHGVRVQPLRVTTWLAPSLPLPLFETLGATIGRRLGRAVEVRAETLESSPRPEADPFRDRTVDVGFLCAPSWARLARGPPPSVVTVPAAPVPLDPRAEGRPVYFSDVIVRAGADARSFADLAGRRWGYNDSCSLSGSFSMRARVPDPDAFFGAIVRTGSHLASLRAVADGEIDGAAIDSTVLAWALPAHPALAGCGLARFVPVRAGARGPRGVSRGRGRGERACERRASATGPLLSAPYPH